MDRAPRSKNEADLLDLANRRLPGGVLGTGRFRDDLAFVVKGARGAGRLERTAAAGAAGRAMIHRCPEAPR